MSTRRLLASLAATLLVLTGCSSDGDGQAIRTVDETATSTSRAPELTPAELVRAAAQAPAHRETVEMEMVIAADGELAAVNRHLTAATAGAVARRAGVANVIPFHFSARYLECEEKVRREVGAAFRGSGEPVEDTNVLLVMDQED